MQEPWLEALRWSLYVALPHGISTPALHHEPVGHAVQFSANCSPGRPP